MVQHTVCTVSTLSMILFLQLVLLLVALGPCHAATLVVPLRRRVMHATTPRRHLLLDGAYQLHGTVKDLEYFYATLELGTPPRPYDLIVDTGSTMTYVPCETCTACGTHKNQPYGPSASSTYSEVACNSDKCACGVPNCGCGRKSRCTYERNYAESSSSKGYLVQDNLLLHGNEQGSAGLHSVPLVFGCAMSETGAIHHQAADGLLGLGNSNASVVNQLVKHGVMVDRFSLCFGTVDGDGALLLGDLALPGNVIEFDYVPLMRTAGHYYIVRMDNMGLGGVPLDIRPGLFDMGYGVVLDSGTTYTHLPREAYDAFVRLLLQYTNTSGLPRIDGPDPNFSTQDICWQGAPSEHHLERLTDVFPTLQLHMGDVTLHLGPVSYLFRHGLVHGAWCLGVFDNGHQGTLLGGITLRNVLVTYDRVQWRVGFAHAPCKRLGLMFSEECHHNKDAPECAPTIRPAHGDPRSSFDNLNEHVLLRIWNRLYAARGQQQAVHENDTQKHHHQRKRRPQQQTQNN